MQTPATEDQIWGILETVEDPEIPVLNVVEMGIVRGVRVQDAGIEVDVTPTYSGCPAMDAIQKDIAATLKKSGFANVSVNTVFGEAWTTDWMTDAARDKLREYGIAPPARLSQVRDPNAPVACPFCGSDKTELRSFFGSTACKAMHFCNACSQPFEAFKCI